MVSHTMCKTLKGERKKKENDSGYCVTLQKIEFCFKKAFSKNESCPWNKLSNY